MDLITLTLQDNRWPTKMDSKSRFETPQAKERVAW